MFQHMFDIVINEEETEENTALVHSEHGYGTSLTKRLNPGLIQLL